MNMKEITRRNTDNSFSCHLKASVNGGTKCVVVDDESREKAVQAAYEMMFGEVKA